jgi:hypothetical protein
MTKTKKSDTITAQDTIFKTKTKKSQQAIAVKTRVGLPKVSTQISIWMKHNLCKCEDKNPSFCC